jgi:hypothetical protein
LTRGPYCGLKRTMIDIESYKYSSIHLRCPFRARV